MPSARQEIVIDVPPGRFWETLVDWERYPEFLPELKDVRVLARDATRFEVSFVVNLIKQIRYRLEFLAEPPHRMTWRLLESNLLIKNEGSWTLLADGPEGGRTRATYDLQVEVGSFVPRAIVTKLVTVSLPKMLAQFKQRAEQAAVTSRSA